MNWTALGTVLAVIVFFSGLYLQLATSIDKKIDVKLKDPEFIRMVANEVRLPFLIFDEDRSVIADTGAMDFIADFKINKDEHKEVSEIIITPKKFLAIPPILESLDSHIAFENPTRGNKFDLIYKTGEGPQYLITSFVPKNPPKKRFRLQIIVSPEK